MAAASASVRVAVVEDDALVRRAITRLLATMGFQVSSFASAEEVLLMMARDGADCLLIDVHLPRLSGLELFHALKRRAWRIPVIFVTADVEMVRSLEMAHTGAPCFLKPVTDQELLVAIMRVTADLN